MNQTYFALGCVGIHILIAILGYALGRYSYVRDTHAIGTLHIVVDEEDGKRYPMLELNNNEDLWNLKTNEIAYFLVKRKE